MSQTIIKQLQSRVALLEKQVESLQNFCNDAHLQIANLIESTSQDQVVETKKTTLLPAGAACHLRKIAEEYIRCQADKWSLSEEDMDDLINVLKRNVSGVSLVAFALNNDIVLAKEMSDE